LRSAASSSKAEEEAAAATAQAVDEAGLARRAVNSAGTDAGAMPPQVRRLSQHRRVACARFGAPQVLEMDAYLNLIL
jgi:hypothetical protein